jgi:chorismate mutase
MDEIKKLRKNVDEIDRKILRLVEGRRSLTKEIGRIKRENGMPYYDKKREEEIVSRLARKSKLDKKFTKKLFMGIIAYCRKNEGR